MEEDVVVDVEPNMPMNDLFSCLKHMVSFNTSMSHHLFSHISCLQIKIKIILVIIVIDTILGRTK